jgi:DNA polymerase-3 subunit beta|tara:strand:- start:356 stop:1453 length:1098 start_codon:yes stop_codon:yes gene_type:complete
MKLSCTQENLASALSIVGPIASKGGSLPILQNILLEAKEGTLQLRATNLEIGITAHVRGKIEQEGTFTVNGRLFYDYVNLLPSDKVEILLAGEHLEVRAGNQQTKINGLSSEEFPVIPSIDGSEQYIVDTNNFREALSQTLFAVALNDARPEISGVLLLVDKKTLILVGTDSYRLAERKVELKSESQKPTSTIIPLRTMQELSRILGQAEGELTITISENQILFNVEDVELISRVIIGTYPDYKQIIPKTTNTKVVLDKEPLVRAIKSASLFCRQGLNHVNFQFSSDKILVSASASQVGENIVEVPAKIEGKDIDIVFDYRFVLDGLTAIEGSDVLIKLESNNSPGVFVSKEESGYLYLVMPIKQ